MKIAVAGASGRMGRMLVEAVAATADCALSGALDVAGQPGAGQRPDGRVWANAARVRITADLRAGLAGADVLIDFTRPEGTLAHLAVCRQLGVNAVIGTTGFSDAQKAQIAEHARHIAIVMAPNMSLGVNVVLKLLDVAARALNTGYDIEVIEAHHRHKVDAPSGTALAMGEVLARAVGRELGDVRGAWPPRRDRRARRRPASAFRSSAAATSSATTPCSSPAPASASRSRTRAPAAPPMPRAACARRASWPGARPACTA